MKKAILGFLVLGLAACSSGYYASVTAQGSGSNGGGSPSTITTTTATSAQCPTGGVVLTVNGTANVICNGSNGATGANGSSSTVYVVAATNSQCPAGGSVLIVNGVSSVICNGVAGATGSTGASGSNGTKGSNGTSFLTGTGAPATNVNQSGDTYLDLSTFNLYVNSNGNWTLVGNIKGATGATGSAGTNGGPQPGLICNVYSILQSDESGVVNWNKMFTDGKLMYVTTIQNINLGNESNQNVFPGLTSAQQAILGYANYAFDCYGYLNVPVTGTYSFEMYSDDGSQFEIDNNVVLNMPTVQVYTSQTSCGQTLFAGLHPINVLYFQGPPVMIGWTLMWQGPANAGLGTMSVIPATAFVQ